MQDPILQLRDQFIAGHEDEAIAGMRRIVHSEPDALIPLRFLVRCLIQTGQAEDAANLMLEYCSKHSEDLAAKRTLAEALSAASRFEEGLEAIRDVVVKDPGNGDVVKEEIEILFSAKAFDEAVARAHELARRYPFMPASSVYLALCLDRAGHTEEVWQTITEALERFPGHCELCRWRAFQASYRDDLSEEEYFGYQRAAAEALESATPLLSTTFPHNRDSHRKLRLGYVSPDFRHHSVAQFIHGVIQHHDRKNFHVTCYMRSYQGDSATKLFREAADRFRPMQLASSLELAQQIRDDKIDILVDLAGHSAGSSLESFAMRPAPVQITYLGHPASTGMTRMQYRIVDSTTDPEGAEAFHSEQLLRLPGPFLCYAPLRPMPAMSRNGTGSITFGYLANTAKVSRTTARLWARCLREVPESRLLLASSTLDPPRAREALRVLLEEAGMPMERVTIRGGEAEWSKFAEFYREVDIALDPTPYNGTTTTFEVLSAGIPTVTLTGTSHRARVSTTILQHLGHPEWIAKTADDYIRIARDLAADSERLAALRNSLPSARLDPSAFTYQLEDAYLETWDRWCANPQ